MLIKILFESIHFHLKCRKHLIHFNTCKRGLVSREGESLEPNVFLCLQVDGPITRGAHKQKFMVYRILHGHVEMAQ